MEVPIGVTARLIPFIHRVSSRGDFIKQLTDHLVDDYGAVRDSDGTQASSHA
jgi:hypothetical protein